MNPSETLPAFDRYLEKLGLHFEAVVIGGSALGLLGVISRETQDCDVLDPDVPPEILKAADDFAKESRQNGHDLKAGWLDHGPKDLRKILPVTWRAEIVPLYTGKNLRLHSLGRMDLLRTKLFAYCDRALDLNDCIALKPSRDELIAAWVWVKLQDQNPLWPEHVEESLRRLAKDLGYEL